MPSPRRPRRAPGSPAPELAGRGWITSLLEPPGLPSSLFVQNPDPEAAALSDHILVDRAARAAAGTGGPGPPASRRPPTRPWPRPASPACCGPATWTPSSSSEVTDLGRGHAVNQPEGCTGAPGERTRTRGSAWPLAGVAGAAPAYWCTAESNCVVFAFAALGASGRWRFLGPQTTALCQASSIAGLGLGSGFGFVSQRSGWCAGPATTRRRRRSRRGRNSRRPGGGGSRESGSLADSAGLP